MARGRLNSMVRLPFERLKLSVHPSDRMNGSHSANAFDKPLEAYRYVPNFGFNASNSSYSSPADPRQYRLCFASHVAIKSRNRFINRSRPRKTSSPTFHPLCQCRN